MKETDYYWINKINDCYYKQFVIMPDGTKKHVLEFEDRSVDKELYKQLKMNSYATDLFFKKMDDELLIERAEYYITQCSPYSYPSPTYNDALIHCILPELIKRFKEKIKEE